MAASVNQMGRSAGEFYVSNRMYLSKFSEVNVRRVGKVDIKAHSGSESFLKNSSLKVIGQKLCSKG